MEKIIEDKIQKLFSEIRSEYALEGEVNIDVHVLETRVLCILINGELNFIEPVA